MGQNKVLPGCIAQPLAQTDVTSDIFALLLHNGRKWRCVIHLFFVRVFNGVFFFTRTSPSYPVLGHLLSSSNILSVKVYLSSGSPSPLVSSLTVAREQLSFLRMCFWLTVSAWWSASGLQLSCSGLECECPLAVACGAEACPFSSVCCLETCASGDSVAGACRLCLVRVFLRSLATFRAELFLFRAGDGSFAASSPPSPPERDTNRWELNTLFSKPVATSLLWFPNWPWSLLKRVTGWPDTWLYSWKNSLATVVKTSIWRKRPERQKQNGFNINETPNIFVLNLQNLTNWPLGGRGNNM